MDVKYIVVLIGGIVFIILGAFFFKIRHNISDSTICGICRFFGVFLILCGIILIVSSFGANNSAKERDALESEVVESYKDGAELYINGEKKDNIDLDGVNLDNYDITVEKDKIYLKEK